MDKETLYPFYESLMDFLAMSKLHMLKIAAEHGLTSVQAFVLLRTKQHMLPTMHSLCSMLGCDASNVTGIVDGLERKGLLTRAEHPSDRRIKTLQLLPKGVLVRNALLEQYADENTSRILAKLSNDEIREFTRLIRKVTAVCPEPEQ